MTDEKLFELMKRVDPLTKRIPPGLRAIAAEIAAVERDEIVAACDALCAVASPSWETLRREIMKRC